MSALALRGSRDLLDPRLAVWLEPCLHLAYLSYLKPLGVSMSLAQLRVSFCWPMLGNEECRSCWGLGVRHHVLTS